MKPTVLLAAFLVAAGLSQTALAIEAPAATQKVTPSFLSEVRSRAVANLRLSDSQVDALLSRLGAMNFNQVQELVTGPASRLQQLVPGAPATSGAAAGSATQRTTSQQGVDGSSSGGNATQAAISGQQASRGGIKDDSGSKSDGATCDACAQRIGSNNDQESEDVKEVKLSSGGSAFLYSDGSFTIVVGGKTEVYDSNNVPQTRNAKWTANKTPVPDDDGGSRSGSVTKNEWNGILARKGSKGAPQESKTGSVGMKTSTTTAAGTPTGFDSQVSVDLVQLQEAIRIAVEKFGPKLH